MKKLFLIIPFVLMLFGCAATQSEMSHNATMYDKQVAAAAAVVPTPIFQMTAHEGQTMSFSGVKSISVYNPGDSTKKPPEYKPLKTGAEVFMDGVLGLAKVGTDVVKAKFGLDLGLADMNRGPADTELLKQINRSNTVETRSSATSTAK